MVERPRAVYRPQTNLILEDTLVKQRIPPALALFLIAPIFGELVSGSSPLNEYINPVTFITLSLLYGCGAIIVRELAIRWQKGWLSIFILGAAYGIYEEGILVQSFFDPGWQDLGSLSVYGRILGVNWVWTEHLTIFHMLISIAASIAFVEVLYPEKRAERWVSSRGWWIANWIGVLSLVIPWKIMVKYNSGGWWWLSWLVVIGLGFLAKTVPAHPLKPHEKDVPKPWRFYLTGFLGFFIQFVIVYSSADRQTTPFPVIMLSLIVFDLLMLWLILRMSGNGAAWDDRHRMALIIGALSFFLVIGPLTTNGQYPVMYFSNPIFLFLLWLAYRSVKKRVLNEQNPIMSEAVTP
jgi:hypothetical protein